MLQIRMMFRKTLKGKRANVIGIEYYCQGINKSVKQTAEINKILSGKAGLIDIFELKDEFLQNNTFIFKTASWSMFPVLRKGDTLRVVPVGIEDLRIGDIPVYRHGEKLCSHRLVDKQTIDGKRFIITLADSSPATSAVDTQERIPERDIVGKVVEVKRGRRRFSTEKRAVGARDRFFYAKASICLRLENCVKKTQRHALIAIQSFKLYEIFGRVILRLMKPYLHFELVMPLRHEGLFQPYKYIAIKDNYKMDYNAFRNTPTFYLIMKLNTEIIGYAGFLNRPRDCEYKGVRISDFYIRLRYRGLGLDLVLQQKAKEITESCDDFK